MTVKPTFSGKIYETESGLKYWIELKRPYRSSIAKTIVTSNPDISILIVPGTTTNEQIFIFFYNEKKFAFAKPAAFTGAYTNEIADLADRNPELDLVFSRIVQPTVDWRSLRASDDELELFEERFTIPTDSVPGTLSEFNEMTKIFFELMQWFGEESGGMHRGFGINETKPLTPINVGLDVDFTEGVALKGESK